jgi:lipoyl-dependent peroxiredoxin
MKTLYETKGIAVGGRGGNVRTEDGQFSAKLALPTGLGGKGDGNNPEQFFACGYAACFGGALMSAARNKKVALKDADVEITADVKLMQDDKGGFNLQVALTGNLAGVDKNTSQQLMEAAHQICPYSKATRGNIEVTLHVK